MILAPRALPSAQSIIKSGSHLFERGQNLKVSELALAISSGSPNRWRRSCAASKRRKPFQRAQHGSEGERFRFPPPRLARTEEEPPGLSQSRLDHVPSKDYSKPHNRSFNVPTRIEFLVIGGLSVAISSYSEQAFEAYFN